MLIKLGKKKINIDQKVIRFKRRGKIRNPNFDIIVVKKSLKESTGNFYEKLGHYDPNINEKKFFVDLERLAFWVNRGAIVHKTLKKHLVKFLI